MTLLVLKKEQRICRIGAINVGGQPGENPPLMIGSMFHDKDKLLENRAERKFNRNLAVDLIKRQNELSEITGVPVLVDLVAMTSDEMKTYIEFFLSVSDAPFAIDMWRSGPRMEAVRYVASLGIQDRVVYNSFTHWDGNVAEQAAELKELGFKHIVVQTFEKVGQFPEDILKSLQKMLSWIGESTFETVLVDTASTNLASIGLASLASRMVKEEFGFPVGCCPTVGTSTWKGARDMFGNAGFLSIDAVIHSLAAFLWNDFIFYGPLVSAKRLIPAIAATEVIRTVNRSFETGELTDQSNHPVNLLFSDFARIMRELLSSRRL